MLPQSVSDFVDSPWEALPSLRSSWGGVERSLGGWEERREWKLELVRKIKRLFKKYKKETQANSHL